MQQIPFTVSEIISVEQLFQPHCEGSAITQTGRLAYFCSLTSLFQQQSTNLRSYIPQPNFSRISPLTTLFLCVPTFLNIYITAEGCPASWAPRTKSS